MSKPKDGCPECGGRLEIYGTIPMEGITRRYVECVCCGACYVTHQNPPKIIRKVSRREDSTNRNKPLRLAIRPA